MMRNRCLLKIIGTVIPTGLLILIACSAAMAQRGGKAEPNRIEFWSSTPIGITPASCQRPVITSSPLRGQGGQRAHRGIN